MIETTLLTQIFIFVLAASAGFELIAKVPPSLHTPLMSSANAVSGITLLGAILVAGQLGGMTATILGLSAVILSAINVVGGFMVTDRMLSMFRKDKRKQE